MNYERRTKPRPTLYEILDVELAHVFHCETRDAAEAFLNAIELIGHRGLLKEIKP